MDSETEPHVTSLLAVQDDVQQPDSETIQVIRAVESVTDAVIAVSGLTIDIAGAGIDGELATGATAQVQGKQGPQGAVTTQYVWVLESTPAPTATAESNIIPFVIEGPVQALRDNRVRIHGFDLELDDDPRLQAVMVGDVLRISGEVDDDRLDDLFDDGIDADIDDDHFVTVRNTRLGFLSNQIYANDNGHVWRDSGSCADAPAGWASASEWRGRCSGEYGGVPPATGASAFSSGSGSGSSGASAPPPPPPLTGGDGDSSSGSFSG
ncbi:MAG TPA: hypothetical protein VK879_17105 [Candidatus Sulfomarinibacteraceae bacterium]|nr:hypothetical protein [Candidatus Sulfomarinibacteraceae bacterium]